MVSDLWVIVAALAAALASVGVMICLNVCDRAPRQSPAAPRAGRQRVYIAGPMSLGDREDHVRRAVEVHGWLIGAGYAPLCPQLQIYAEDQHGLLFCHREWMEVDLAWLGQAALVVRLAGASRGAEEEELAAARWGIPVYHAPRHLGREALLALLRGADA